MDAGPDPLSPEAQLPWPLIAIDFEASALGGDSYPIEVGVVRWTAPEAPIQVWSSLIRPASAWLETGRWSAESEAIHGIAAKDLASGISPEAAMIKLNSIIGTHTVWCDGGAYDEYWLRTLEAAAQVERSFSLGDWDALEGAFTSLAYERMVRWLERAAPRHRAGDDAERLLRAVAVGLGRRYASSELLEERKREL